mmetsp:Transcript_75770/g.133861  ORF Transcript_75770/g.133861 Transcript_75770/m.133861 type:complete len:91 (+) Transcript_75770:1418-1690(+)
MGGHQEAKKALIETVAALQNLWQEAQTAASRYHRVQVCQTLAVLLPAGQAVLLPAVLEAVAVGASEVVEALPARMWNKKLRMLPGGSWGH